MVGGTAVVFIDGQFETNALPGAGIIPAGLLENELRIVSKIDPDSHIKRLRTGWLGCCAMKGRLSVLLPRLGLPLEYLTARYHDYPSRTHPSIEQTLRQHEVPPSIDLRPACPAYSFDRVVSLSIAHDCEIARS